MGDELKYEHLPAAMAANGYSQAEGMNALTDAGIISDNCVFAGHVASPDRETAMAWLENNPLTESPA